MKGLKRTKFLEEGVLLQIVTPWIKVNVIGKWGLIKSVERMVFDYRISRRGSENRTSSLSPYSIPFIWNCPEPKPAGLCTTHQHLTNTQANTFDQVLKASMLKDHSWSFNCCLLPNIDKKSLWNMSSICCQESEIFYCLFVLSKIMKITVSYTSRKVINKFEHCHDNGYHKNWCLSPELGL